MGEILIGTSGFYYEDWKEVFYPKEVPKKDYLSYYSRHFNVIELNYTYYKLPSSSQSSQMLAKAEGRLTFVIKAHRQMTHEISHKSIREIVPRYIEGILPFAEAERLGGLLLQFPQSFHYNTENRVYLKSLIDTLSSFPLFVEFRRKDWLKDSVYKTLHELGTGFVCVDEPALPSLIPPLNISTSNIGYVRFHGRNKKNWYNTDSTSRYDYLYSEEELMERLPGIRKMAEGTEKLFAFFNNHAKAQAIDNAGMLINML